MKYSLALVIDNVSGGVRLYDMLRPNICMFVCDPMMPDFLKCVSCNAFS